HKSAPNALKPLRGFISSGNQTAFHLLRDPDLKTHSVLDAQTFFRLPDLGGALLDYMKRAQRGAAVFSLSGQRTNAALPSPFPFKVQLWSKFRIQGRQYHNTHLPNDIHTVFATPPGPEWEYGRNDCVVINIDNTKLWPHSSLEGHCIALVKMIFLPSYGRNSLVKPLRGTEEFLVYCERFDVVNQPPPPPQYNDIPCYQAWKPFYPDYASGCYILKKALRANGTPFGDIIPLPQFRAQVDVSPRLRGPADSRLSPMNVMAVGSDFLLNKYWEKELWYILEKADPCVSSNSSTT
ncbi:hypothetical protein DFH05DRAFT_1621065, partial [Lentinula detonsa]